MVARGSHALGRLLIAPLGYLAFVVALAALSAAASLLGEEHELGFFAGRLNRMIWRYPEITRPGVQVAWLVWIALFCLAVSPLDPITSRWDEVLLLALAAGAVWRRMIGGRRVGR
jgi:dolichol kinase